MTNLRDLLPWWPPARARVEDARKWLAAAATHVGFEQPRAHDVRSDPYMRWSSRGQVGGCPALLLAGDGGALRIDVEVRIASLPSDLVVAPRPRGRGEEDYHLGVIVGSGDVRVDEHFCVASTRALQGGELERRARALPPELLDFLASVAKEDVGLRVWSTMIALHPVGWLRQAERDPQSDGAPESVAAAVLRAAEIVDVGRSFGVLTGP